MEERFGKDICEELKRNWNELLIIITPIILADIVFLTILKASIPLFFWLSLIYDMI